MKLFNCLMILFLVGMQLHWINGIMDDPLDPFERYHSAALLRAARENQARFDQQIEDDYQSAQTYHPIPEPQLSDALQQLRSAIVPTRSPVCSKVRCCFCLCIVLFVGFLGIATTWGPDDNSATSSN